MDADCVQWGVDPCPGSAINNGTMGPATMAMAPGLGDEDHPDGEVLNRIASQSFGPESSSAIPIKAMGWGRRADRSVGGQDDRELCRGRRRRQGLRQTLLPCRTSINIPENAFAVATLDLAGILGCTLPKMPTERPTFCHREARCLCAARPLYLSDNRCDQVGLHKPHLPHIVPQKYRRPPSLFPLLTLPLIPRLMLPLSSRSKVTHLAFLSRYFDMYPDEASISLPPNPDVPKDFPGEAWYNSGEMRR